MANLLPALAVVALLVGGYLWLSASQKPKGKLPPGPKPAALMGNVKDMPPPGEPEFLFWHKHKALYGPVSSVTVFGQSFVLIHGRKEARDLLEKASMKTSDRPAATFVSEICGYENTVVGHKYDKTFRHYRKLLHQELGTKSKAARYQNIQELEARRMLLRVRDDSDKLLEHYKTAVGATILKLAYGYTIEPHKADPLVSLNERVMQQFILAVTPMSWAVDLFPALRYLPDGFPGASFKAKGKEWSECLRTIVHTPFRFVQTEMTSNKNYQECYISKLLQNPDGDEKGAGPVTLSPEVEHDIVWSAGSLYAAGVDTQALTLAGFTLAMIRFPEVQRKAQEEIDRVIGTHRLPSFEDREKLPYVQAVFLEALRWWAVLPLGIPHVATEAFEYEGMFIPKGSFLIANIWSLMHDPETYADPEAFDPDRFLEPRNEPDPSPEAFGYGRRICPGRLLAESTVWVNIASLLATYNISHALDKDGKKISVDHVKPSAGTTSTPSDFQFKITPRSEVHQELIKRFEVEHPWDESSASRIKMTSK
ncbi:hypothetical protein V2G26_018867 [Clonostachys chloroleuca]